MIWKGAISFGLVHVPVALYPASREDDIDFDWIDKRSMDPVGYKRINKRTGKAVPSDAIVRGVKVADGEYVVLGNDEIKAAYPRTTQTIGIESFAAPTEVPFTLLEKPYYLAPLPRAQKVYALLREAMRASGVVGVARLVLHTKEHLAVLVPVGPALMLSTLRWASEVLPWDTLELPGEGPAELGDAELKMARELIGDMTETWNPERYQDRFTEAVRALVEQRARAGKTEPVQPLEPAESAAEGSNVVDLTELLRRSLRGRDKPARARPRKAAAASSKPHKPAQRKRA
jgi:DNA end-binding protein Ku